MADRAVSNIQPSNYNFDDLMASYTIPSAGKATTILDCAEALFGRHGFDGVSMSTLAKEAGVSKANIFHHFKTKEELYMTVLHRARKRFVSQLLSVANEQSDTQHRVRSLIQAYPEQMLANEPVVRLLTYEFMEKHHPGQVLSERLFADNISELITLIKEAQAKGELRTGFDPGMVMLIVAGFSFFYIQGRDFLRHLPEMEWIMDPNAVSYAMWKILWHGIAPNDTTETMDVHLEQN